MFNSLRNARFTINENVDINRKNRRLVDQCTSTTRVSLKLKHFFNHSTTSNLNNSKNQQDKKILCLR